MRVDDCEMLEVATEPGALNYRLRHKRTGEVVSVHILTGAAPSGELLIQLQNLSQQERSRVLDHGREGSLTWFVTRGLPNGESFVRWLNGSRANGDADAMTADRMQRLREVFEKASVRLPEERSAFVAQQCGGDQALESRVLRMLGIGGADQHFLDVPAAEHLVNESAGTASAVPPTESFESEFAEGSVIGERYVVEREVGSGGFGIIYLAHDLQVNGRHVVLKVRKGDIDPMNPELIKRFQREVASLARIAHPSVVGVLDVGQTAKGTPYFVMQYVAGQTLRQTLKVTSPMPLPRVAAIVRQISHALTVAHEKGICHRDLKPENVMLQDLGDGEELAIIIDFGIATMKENDSAKTAYTRAIGTVAYMPPEQREGRPTAASDTYALGVMTFEMLAGRRPTRFGDSRQQRLSALRRGVPKAAESAIARAMSADPADRQNRTRDFGDEIWSALQRVRTPRRVLLMHWVLVVVIGISVGFAIQRLIPRTPPDTIQYHVGLSAQGYRLRLQAPHAGHMYVVEELQPKSKQPVTDHGAAFKVLFPDLSYFASQSRYLNGRSVEFTVQASPGRPRRILWAFWSDETVEAVEALGRAERGAKGVPMVAPQMQLLVRKFEDSGTEQISPGLLMKSVVLEPRNDGK